MPKINSALISVYNKTGVVKFAQRLSDLGISITSTGGTAALLKEKEISCSLVEDITQSPEYLDGRVKTLHPYIFMSILARRNKDDHIKTLEKHNLPGIDLVVVNLYPFIESISMKDISKIEVLEQIDIGGVSLLRAAAKNPEHVIAVTSPDDYDSIVKTLSENNNFISEKLSLRLASDVFSLTSSYDWFISRYLSELSNNEDNLFPENMYELYKKATVLRYGENPHQKAAFYQRPLEQLPYKQLSGKQLSFNNLVDIDTALSLSHEYETPSAAIIKHANPCGVGSDKKLVAAFEKALSTDSVSAFGGVIGLNRPLDVPTADKISQMFVEVLIAPDFEPDAFEIVSQKKNLRILKSVPDFYPDIKQFEMKTIHGGVLIQDKDIENSRKNDFKVVTSREPTGPEWEALVYGWILVKYVKSNCIIYCATDRTLGIGIGQPSRIDAAEIAAHKAQKENLDLKGSAVISDAFFPFRDGVDAAHKTGATAIIQPGGSIHDDEVIAAAEEHNISMVFTGIRHFRH